MAKIIEYYLYGNPDIKWSWTDNYWSCALTLRDGNRGYRKIIFLLILPKIIASSYLKININKQMQCNHLLTCGPLPMCVSGKNPHLLMKSVIWPILASKV